MGTETHSCINKNCKNVALMLFRHHRNNAYHLQKGRGRKTALSALLNIYIPVGTSESTRLNKRVQPRLK